MARQSCPMPFVSVREPVLLSDEDLDYLEQLTRSRTTRKDLHERAEIVLLSHHGKSDSAIARELGITRQKVIRTINRVLALVSGGVKGSSRARAAENYLSRKQGHGSWICYVENPWNSGIPMRSGHNGSCNNIFGNTPWKKDSRKLLGFHKGQSQKLPMPVP
jgi:hypothetical protein